MLECASIGKAKIPTCFFRDTIHRIENTGKGELIFIEIQLGNDLKEEDIIRIEDDYGRV